MTHTYNLIEARISMEAGKIKKKEKKGMNQIVSFRKLLLCASFSFLSRLGKSSKKIFFVCVPISKLTMKQADSCFIFLYRFAFHA